MRLLLMMTFLLAIASCKTGNSIVKKSAFKRQDLSNQETTLISSVIIYKTKGDYKNLIPITLSDDGERIVSYPDPKDVRIEIKYETPTLLNDGYLLDHLGISKNTVFLEIDYESYAQLEQVPSLSELKSMIINRNPLLELYNCGNQIQYKNLEKDLNHLIDLDQLKENCSDLLK